MSQKIKILDEVTINQIAAGEVIENGASVVKELVDNSLDAGATKIIIEAIGSGRQALSIQDNGFGIGYEDLLLCLERHATSKISCEEDLWRLSTMGFRGEALSAISSISRLSILTAVQDPKNSAQTTLDGFLLTSSAGKIKSCSPTIALGGTKIVIEELFFNVPARRKFLKSPNQEAKEILKVVILQALVRPDVAFELIMNQKKELSLEKDVGYAGRIKKLLGEQFFSDLVPITYQNEWCSITGYVGKPTASRPTRGGQYLFVNGRAVNSHFFSQVVRESYGSSLEEGRHPVFVLYLDIAKEKVDINVHPQKKEVRFSSEQELKSFVLMAVSKHLFCERTAQVVDQNMPMPVQAMKESSAPSQRMPSFAYLPATAPKPPAPVLFEELKIRGRVLGIYEEYILADIAMENMPSDLSKEGLFFVHSRHAMARIAYEDFYMEEKTKSIQQLLVPHFIECTLEHAESIKVAFPNFQKMGIAIREFGTNSFLIEAVPTYLEHIDLEEFLYHIACSEDQKAVFDEVQDRLVREACRFQKKNLHLGTALAETILKRLLRCNDPFRCPIGNKTLFVLTNDEIRKRL